jgi:hypothetical protein
MDFANQQTWRTFITGISFLAQHETTCRSLPLAFPAWASKGHQNVAVAIFTFPSLETFGRYRMAVSEDELCKTTTARFNETKCFTQYERTFLVPMFE